ncbi:MAG: DoxX family protein [Aigarchaeota archaeon]|nr:DoxX family protein [Aigarchaeota archaeon]MDW8092595.1 DoxX family protein [Nitrososphaerota archaeon]
MAILDFLASYEGVGLLVLRASLGFIMMVHGIPKLVNPSRAAMRGGMRQLGIRGWLFDLVALLELIGGLFLMLGLLTRVVSLLFALQMIGTIVLYTAVIYKVVPPPEILQQMVQMSRKNMRAFVSAVGGWEFDLLILGASVLLLITGAGSLSLDAVLGI